MGRALARSSATLAALRRTRACPVNRRRRSENPHGHGPAADGGRPVTAYRIYRCTRMASSGDGGRDHRPGFGSAPSRESSRKSAETFPPTAITFSAWRARATSIRFPSGGAESYRRAVTERRPPRHSAGTNAVVLVDAGSRAALIPRNLTLLANRSSLDSGSSAARPDRRSPWQGLRPSRSDHQGREAPPQDTSTATPSPSKYSG